MRLPEERSIYGHHERLTVYLDRVIHWAGNPELGILKRLMHLSLRAGPVWQSEARVEAIPLDRLLPYLKIPSLRSLHVYELVERPGPALPDNMEIPLTHLHFNGIREILYRMPNFLSMCPRLESFTWRQHRNHAIRE